MRGQLTIDLADPATGNAVAGATATVKKVDGSNATIFAARTGGGTTANPLVTNSSGTAQGWLDRGLYRIVYAGGVTRPDEWINIAPTDDGEIDTLWLPAGYNVPADDSVVAQKLDPATVRAILGLNSTGQARRGKAIIATSEARTSTSYGLLTTPDRVSSLILPADGLIRVRYAATWQESVAGAARAAIFIGANQLKIANQAANAAITQAAATAETTGAVDKPLISYWGGLVSLYGAGAAYGGDVTTGQAIGLYGASQGISQEINGGATQTGNPATVGGAVDIFAAAGTYDISIQFKSSSGSVTVKNRKLWVEVISFG